MKTFTVSRDQMAAVCGVSRFVFEPGDIGCRDCAFRAPDTGRPRYYLCRLINAGLYPQCSPGHRSDRRLGVWKRASRRPAAL